MGKATPVNGFISCPSMKDEAAKRKVPSTHGFGWNF